MITVDVSEMSGYPASSQHRPPPSQPEPCLANHPHRPEDARQLEHHQQFSAQAPYHLPLEHLHTTTEKQKEVGSVAKSKKKVPRIPKEWKQKYGRNSHSSCGTFDQDAETRLIQALHHVQKTGQNITEAAKQFGVPRSTLNERLKRDDPFAKRVRGTHPTLTKEDEDVLCKWLITVYRRGRAITPKRFATAVKELLDGPGRMNVFANKNRPTSGWMKTFRRRHPTIKFIKHDKWNDPKNVSAKNMGWMDDLLEHLKEESADPTQLLVEPNGSRMFCLADYAVGVQFDGTAVNSINKNDNTNKTDKSINILCCVNAEGTYLPPCFLYPDRVPLLHPISHLVDLSTFNVGLSNLSLLNSHDLYFWMTIFIAYLDCEKVPRPVILMLKGDYSIATLPLCGDCAKAGIILHIIPKVVEDFLNPLDVFLFESLNSNYMDLYTRYVRSYLVSVTLDTFPQVFMEAWNKVKNPAFARNRFHACGIVSLIKMHVKNAYENNVDRRITPAQVAHLNVLNMSNTKMLLEPASNPNRFGVDVETQLLKTKISGRTEISHPEDSASNITIISDSVDQVDQKHSSIPTVLQLKEINGAESMVKDETALDDSTADRGSTYIDGLNAGLSTIVSFVPSPIRRIYQEWIDKGVDSETKDPVFLVWRSVDTLLRDARRLDGSR